MRQIVLLEHADLQLLQRGQTVTLTVNGQSIDIALERVRVTQGIPPSPRATLAAQRGNCPYCHRSNLLLAPHIRANHPGKSIPWLGSGGITCPTCKRTFPSNQSLAKHRMMMHTKRPMKKPRTNRKTTIST